MFVGATVTQRKGRLVLHARAMKKKRGGWSRRKAEMYTGTRRRWSLLYIYLILAKWPTRVHGCIPCLPACLLVVPVLVLTGRPLLSCPSLSFATGS